MGCVDEDEAGRICGDDGDVGSVVAFRSGEECYLDDYPILFRTSPGTAPSASPSRPDTPTLKSYSSGLETLTSTEQF